MKNMGESYRAQPKKEAAKEGAGAKERRETSMSAIKERIALAPARRTLALVRDNPGPGQLTVDELSSLDPESSADDDFAAAASMTAATNDGQFTKEQFIAYVSDDEQDRMTRYQTTVDRMLEAGVLEIVDGKIHCNIDFRRR